MKFLIINGSPKGDYSITLQTSLYIQKLYPDYEYDFINVGQQIKALEKDFSKAIDKINNADVLVFSYPVYTFYAPSQLHRFIELLKEQNLDLSSKYATQITTSKHFFDMTAHKYIEDNCYDLKLKYIKGISLDMDDLPTKNGQLNVQKYFNFLLHSLKEDLYEHAPHIFYHEVPSYEVSLPVVKNKLKTKKVTIICDLKDEDTSLHNMIEDFINNFPYEIKIVNLRKYPFAGGCLGCFSCAGDGKCIYKDNFDTYLREEILTSDSLIYAFSIKDHSMGSRFKMYDDRQFCNGHRIMTDGLPIAYIINGDYDNEENLKTVIEARADVAHNYLAGICTSKESIIEVSKKLVYALENHYVTPRQCYGVGGNKIFRDLIWIMRGLMRADHKFYKKTGVYDFPQKQRGRMILMCFIGAMANNKRLKAKMGNKMNEGMVAPYKKAIKNAKILTEDVIHEK